MRLRAAAALRPELAIEFFEDRGPVALAGKLAVEATIEYRLDADPPEDAHHLHLHRQTHWVEFIDRSPRQDLIAAIGANQMLDLLRCRKTPPAGRKVGHTRHIGERDYAAVFETDALLACSFERRACHRPEHVAGVRRLGNRASVACARVRSLFSTGGSQIFRPLSHRPGCFPRTSRAAQPADLSR